MKDVMIYQDYIGSVHYSTEDETFFGKIEGINDLISFEGASVGELKAAFEEAVEDYFELCRLNEKEPERMYKGSFNIRIRPELHKQAAQMAMIEGKSLNQYIEDAIEQYSVNKALELGLTE
ncbi:type II toxin-antitoxin system HicB family antitoxin [Desulfoscipio sp. XC116]|uniref:type II toxin-antitoxin system HicB family antitoxin n=1 Tax=Desulfoscipio sp. XC116 TaxID=3144975 RepID=UPI00325A5DA2